MNDEAIIKESRPYVLWRRVSTKEQGQSELGLDAQRTIAEMFMGKEPVAVYTDVFSGTKLKQCRGLWEAIDKCKSENCVLVIAKSDRCRNVSEALEILDAIGERNLIFCDLPTFDRFILTVMWAMWERQAIMGRINTKIALQERKKQIDTQGGFISRSGIWRTHLGKPKGYKPVEAIRVQSINRTLHKQEWQFSSPGFRWVRSQVYKGKRNKEILEGFNQLYDDGVEGFTTRNGKRLSKGVLSRWIKEIKRKS